MKKLPIIFTLALAAVCASGCEAMDKIFPKNEETPTDNDDDKKENPPVVTPVDPEEIVMDEYEISLEAEEEHQIRAWVLPKDADQDIDYSSNDLSVASVNETGLVTAVAAGETTIVVSSSIDSEIYELLRVSVTGGKPPVNYTVSFNPNGGTGTMSNQTTKGSTFEAPSCGFSYENHYFTKWALNSADGEKYSIGTTITGISSNITLYACWEAESSTDTYYQQCAGLSGSALESKLKSINKPQHPDYDWPRYEAADEAEDDSSSILCVYTRHNIPKSNHCGNYAWDKWNREHVWTQSKFPASDEDTHNIFACEGQINNYRGNLIFDEGGSIVTVFGHVTECKLQKNTSFEPCDAAKGEIARSVMYGTVMYSYTMTQEIKSIELALKWHLEHAITTRETKRNNVVHQLQGNRNPFVDHPEYACKIWKDTNDATRSICSAHNL